MALFSKKKSAEQTEKEDEISKLVESVKKKYRDAYDSKAKKHEIWDKCYKAYTGELFKNPSLPKYKSQEVSNFIFSTVETVKPIMLSNKPKLLCLPHSEADYEKSERIQKALDYEWDRTQMFIKMCNALSNGLIYGTAIVGVLWNGKQNNGLGNVDPVVISPFNFFVDPMATSIDDAEYVIYATYKNVGEIIKAYPEKSEELKNSTEQANDTYLMYGRNTEGLTGKDTILYIECYQRDYSVIEDEIEEDGKKYKITRMKYPRGRRIVIAGDVLLDDSENPYKDGKFPFRAWKCYEISGQFWGIGEVEQIISPQEYANKLTNNLLTNARLMANPVWIVDKNSGIAQNSLTNQDGLVVRKNPGTDVKREAPPPMPGYIRDTIEMLKNDIEIISGVFDVTRGERPGGITAAAAIQALNEQAQGRIKLKLQTFEVFIAEIGGLWLSRIQQFWVTARSVRIMGKDYKVSFDTVSKDDIDGDYDVIIATGSTMPVNKTARLQQIIQMAQTPAEDGLPLVDRKTVLEFSEIGEIEPILERFEAIKNEQMMQQQQAQEQQMIAEQQRIEQEQIAKQEELTKEERKHQMDLEKEKMKQEYDMSKMALQQQANAVQSESEESNIMEENETEGVSPEIVQLVQILEQATPEELEQILIEYPELKELLESIISE